MSKKPTSRKPELISSSGKRIWVTNFSEFTLEEDLWELFQPFGDIDSISIVRKYPKQPMAFIDMKNSSKAQNAIRDLDKHTFQGRNIAVRASALLRKSEVYLSERKASSLECGALHRLGFVQIRRRKAPHSKERFALKELRNNSTSIETKILWEKVYLCIAEF